MSRNISSQAGHNPIEAQLLQIERVDKRIDHAHGITLIDPVIQAFRQQCRLIAISPFNESLHQSPPQIARLHIPDSTFSRSQGQNLKKLTQSGTGPLSGAKRTSDEVAKLSSRGVRP